MSEKVHPLADPESDEWQALDRLFNNLPTPETEARLIAEAMAEIERVNPPTKH